MKKLTAIFVAIILICVSFTAKVDAAMLDGVIWADSSIGYVFASNVDSHVVGMVNSAAAVWSSMSDINFIYGRSNTTIDATYQPALTWDGLTQHTKSGATGFVQSCWVTINTARTYSYGDYGEEEGYKMQKSVIYHELGHVICLGEDNDAPAKSAVMIQVTEERAWEPTSRDINYVNNAY